MKPLLSLTTEEEADVPRQGGEPAVPPSHDAKPLEERGAVIACGDPLVEVVDEIVVDAVLAMDGINDLDAPVVVCRVAIAQVVERSELASWYESLVADEHTIGKGALRQLMWRAQPTRMEVLVSTVYNHRVAIEEVRLVRLKSSADGADRVRRAERIARIEIPDVGARGLAQPFIHRIVEPMVRLGVDGSTRVERLDERERFVLGSSVYDEVLKALVTLLGKAAQGGRNGCLRIVADGDDG